MSYNRVTNRGGRNRRCLMKRERMRLLTLAAATIAFVVLFAMRAGAEIRVAASVSVPGVMVSVGTVPSCHYTIEQYRPMPERRYMYYEVTRQDRMIARRVNWYTGVPLGELLRLRRDGYDWFEIGIWLHMARPVVRAAMDQRSWDRFVLDMQRHKQIFGKQKHVVTYYDGREYRKR
jgi:hypothetical protein